MSALHRRTAYPALSSSDDLAALNPSLDLTQPLTAGMSLCVGGAGSATWCNSGLVSGKCPTELPGTSLVSASQLPGLHASCRA